MSNDKLTVIEAASLCGVHRNTILQWLNKGKVKFEYQPSSGWKLIERSQLLAFNEKRLEAKEAREAKG